jgi:hypothetical protein
VGTRGALPKEKKIAIATGVKGARLARFPKTVDACFARLVGDIGILAPADAALAEDTARWICVANAAFAQLGDEKTGLDLTITDTAHGNGQEARKNPLLIILRTASEQIRANVQQLGATPLARARMPDPEEEEKSIADLLSTEVSKRMNAKR